MTPIISEFPAINIPAYIDPNSIARISKKYFAWKFMIDILQYNQRVMVDS